MYTTMNRNQNAPSRLQEIRKTLEQLQQTETLEQPKMVQVYVEGRTYQTAFCFAAAFEERGGREPYLLATVIGGADSTVQSIKAVIDTGTYGMQFGYGVKGLSSYDFKKELSFFTEKGKYTTFPMSIGNRKALAIIHQDVLDGKYTMSFEQNPAEDVRKVLGGIQYGLPLLEDWGETIYTKLMLEGHLTHMPIYYDKGIFTNGFHLIRFDLTEEEADEIVSKMIINDEIQFQSDVEGTGEQLEEIENLTSYMENFNDKLIDKLSSEVEPGYNPLVDKPHKIFDTYDTQLFPVQAHVASAMAKRLGEGQKSVINQGEMSTGKSKMMTAIADAYSRDIKKKSGYFSIVMVPPSLTDKWATEEIYDLIPNASIILIKNTSELIKYHQNWIKQGRPKPLVPTFFVISFTTIRSGAAIEPAVKFESIKTSTQKSKHDVQPYRFGYICTDCGKPHQVIESKSFEFDQDGNEVVKEQKRLMLEDEFGSGRRLTNSNRPANAFCSECGSSLWKHSTPTRYNGFKDWVKNVENPLSAAIEVGDNIGVTNILKNQPSIPKIVGKPRRVATIEYIRRKMKGFFDVCIIDEIHMLKSGNSAQGNALGSLVAASKKCIAGTGTLFGGKAEDIYYIMWKLFPTEMVKEGFSYENVQEWNEMYGNIERTSYANSENDTEFTNKQSRGGRSSRTTVKVKPGISPFVFGRFLVQNTCLVRLLDVWPDPVELVDVPTILIDMNEEQKQTYENMKIEFETEIEANRFRKEDNIPNLWLLYTETGISYLDNPGQYPEVYGKQKDGKRKLLWEAPKINVEKPLPKEQKLIEIITGEILENRPTIIYVRDTGASNADRDIQPRLKNVLEEHVKGAKVAILRSNTTDTDKRSIWLKNKIEKEGVNVIICSMKLVEVGLDLLKTPTLIFYQFNWSMFTMSQAARRAFRIGQNRECRLYYLAYQDSFQEQMAMLIAQKNRASQAINGSVSSEGLSAMLGESGDLQEMLIKSIKDGETLKGSTEEWIATTTDRAREILNGIGKKKENVANEILVQLLQWARKRSMLDTTIEMLREKEIVIVENIKLGKINGFEIKNGELSVDEVLAFGFDFFTDSDLISHLLAVKPKHIDLNNFEIKIIEVKQTKGKKNNVVGGQLAIDLFSEF